MDSLRRSLLLILLACLIGPRGTFGAAISEIRIDQPGPDRDEFFELMGTPGERLDGLTYVVLGDGPAASGEIEAVISLDGHAIPADGVFLVTEATHTMVADADVVTLLNFENGDNSTHLLVRGFSGHLDQDLDLDNDCHLDVRPWREVIDGVALMVEANPPLTTECHYGDPGAVAGPDGSFPPGSVIRCDGLWLVGGFTFGSDDTPGGWNRPCALTAEPASWGTVRARHP